VALEAAAQLGYPVWMDERGTTVLVRGDQWAWESWCVMAPPGIERVAAKVRRYLQQVEERDPF
jgi:hypothetical protein